MGDAQGSRASITALLTVGVAPMVGASPIPFAERVDRGGGGRVVRLEVREPSAFGIV